MPARTYKAGGLKHTRTSSAGSSKMGLNLHFTQKEPTAGRAGTKGMNGLATDSHAARPKDHQARTGSAIRLDKGKERERPASPAPQAVRRTSSGRGQSRSKRSKGGFAIASPSTEDSDEEEWVSSAAPSGAATPQADSDEESSEDSEDAPPIISTAKNLHKEPKQEPTPAPPPEPTPRLATAVLASADVGRYKDETPVQPVKTRPITPQPPPGITTRQRSSSPTRLQPHRRAPSPPSQATTLQQPQFPSVYTEHTTPPSSNRVSPPSASPGSKQRVTRSANTSPTQAPRPSVPSTRYTLTRPPSTHSINSKHEASLRPHPLIRANSHGRDALAPPGRLTALSVAPTPTSTSPPQGFQTFYQHNTRLSSSPSSVHTMDIAPSSPLLARARAESTLASPADSPAPPTATAEFSVPSAPRAPFPAHDRKRTLSAMSTASGASLAALASLASHGHGGPGHAHTLSHSSSHKRPALPLAVHFPVAPQPGALEAMHPLLPQPYLGQHLSTLRFSNPMKDSYARVMRQKHGW